MHRTLKATDVNGNCTQRNYAACQTNVRGFEKWKYKEAIMEGGHVSLMELVHTLKASIRKKCRDPYDFC